MYGHPKFKPTWNEQTSILHSGVGIITSPQNLNSSLDPWIQGAVALNSPDAPTRYFAPLLGPGGWWRLRVPPSDPSPWLALENPPPPFFQNMAGAWEWVSDFLKKKMCRVPPKALYPFTGRWTLFSCSVAFASSWVMRFLQIIHPQSLGFFGIVPGGLTLHPLEKIGLPYASH